MWLELLRSSGSVLSVELEKRLAISLMQFLGLDLIIKRNTRDCPSRPGNREFICVER
jgi:hypothetical protein